MLRVKVDTGTASLHDGHLCHDSPARLIETKWYKYLRSHPELHEIVSETRRQLIELSICEISVPGIHSKGVRSNLDLLRKNIRDTGLQHFWILAVPFQNLLHILRAE